MRKNKTIYSLLLTILMVTSCSEDLLDVQNENRYDQSTFFKTPQSYVQASTALYTPLLFSGMYSRDWYFVFDLLGNDAEKNTPLQGTLLEFPNYTHTPVNGTISSIYNSLYKMTNRSLFLLDRLNEWNPTKADEIALKERLRGEAFFMKSLGNFWLVTLFGAVPQRTTMENFVLNLPRTPAAEIWNTIEQDLTQAVELLPVSYPVSDLGRATKGAAIALLGKAHLYQKEYDQAITQFVKLTQSPFTYTLVGQSLDDIFINDNEQSKDVIFAVMHGDWQGWGVGDAYYMFGGTETWGRAATHTGRAMEYGFNGGDWHNVLVSKALVNSFKYPDEGGVEYTDPRAANTFYGDAASGGDTEFCDVCPTGVIEYNFAVKNYSWRKYSTYERERELGVPKSGINSQVIRYADALLMLAESYIEKGQMNNALPLINQVRARAGAFQYTTLGTQQQATTILRRERQMELAGEQHRFFDLVRWGILRPTINAEKKAASAEGLEPVQDFHVLLPIPQRERDANPLVAAQVLNNWN